MPSPKFWYCLKANLQGVGARNFFSSGSECNKNSDLQILTELVLYTNLIITTKPMGKIRQNLFKFTYFFNGSQKL